MKKLSNKTQKILIISDSHNLNKLVEKIIKKEKADINICVGDLEQFNDPDTILSDSYRDKLFDYWVYGNHEVTIRMIRNVLDGKWWWENMKNSYKTFMLGESKVLLTHFFEDDSRIMKTVAKQTGKVIDITSWKNKVIAEVKPNIVICGHTHVPTLELGVEYKIKNKTYKFDVLNPGTANVEKNRSKTFTNATYIVGTINDGKKPNWKIVKIV